MAERRREARDDRQLPGGDVAPAAGQAFPDYRFTLANERTFLAWMRTCLALLAAAVAVVQFASDLGSDLFRQICAAVLASLATATAAGGWVRWLLTQRAMATGRPLRHGLLTALTAAGLTGVALAVAVLLTDGVAR